MSFERPFHASVRIDLDLVCTHPQALLRSARESGRAASSKEATADAEAALLALVDVGVTPVAQHVAMVGSIRSAIVSSDWRDARDSRLTGDTETSEVARTGSRLSGIDWALNELFADDLAPSDEADSLRQRTLLKGLLWNASVAVVECLFEDVTTLADRTDDPAAWRDTHVISKLPSRFAQHYDRSFAQKFLAATVEVTSRFAAAWVYPQTVAHELGLRIVLDEAESNADKVSEPMPYAWREHLDHVLFQDQDVERLYLTEQDIADGLDDPILQVPPLDFASWFIPYPNASPSVPYANDEPKEPVTSAMDPRLA
ncbi:hypothetical protein AB3M83_05685 [Microbacterium sp. 179-B 1A2 NHS]|uniref:hypothetical protein n=1 Tax=Microbacterium sp. 179-B 1A2 NHS TaxID=3142383 RepID=UPI0039A0115D